MKENIFIRADGSASMGLGHLVRCMSLAQMLKNDFSICFFAKEIPDSLINEITQNEWNVTVIEKETVFLNSLTGDEIVVLDGYQFDSEYQKKIKNTGCKLVCIDDFHDLHFYADLVINHEPGISEKNYKGEGYTKFLLGPDYALLRPEFLEPGEERIKVYPESINRIIVCFGGSDFKNLTAKVLLWLPSRSYTVRVVLGNAYPHWEGLSNAIEEREDLEIIVKYSLSAKEMKKEFELADLAILPASGIAMEAISINIPFICGYYTANQFRFYNWLRDERIIFDAKKFKNDSFTKAMNNIDRNKAIDLIKNQSRIIDRKSGMRLRNEILKIRG